MYSAKKKYKRGEREQGEEVMRRHRIDERQRGVREMIDYRGNK